MTRSIPLADRPRWIAVVTILVMAGTLRGLWLTADPASSTSTNTGVVWHDEGAWVHNARNFALWGEWRTDEWNPMYIAPVFTGLEAAAFSALGVGTWQARTVPLVSGLIAIVALMWGLQAVAGRRSALIGGLLLATSYTFVAWNRAALMESTMTMFIVVGWAAYARASIQPRWGLLAGVAVVLAFFTKAAAAFFVGAIGLELVTAWWIDRKAGPLYVAAGLALAGIAALALFVIPQWTEFQFYNWAMTVERKPEYTASAFLRNASWLPLTHGVFTRMWLVVLVAGVAAVGIVSRWRSVHPAERLAVLWLLVGLLQLVVHDAGNQRRYVMFVPALIALAALRLAPARALAQGKPLLPESKPAATKIIFSRIAATLTAAVLGYVVIGSLLRLLWLDDIAAGVYRMPVRVSAILAGFIAATVWWKWREWSGAFMPGKVPFAAALAVIAMTTGTDVVLLGRWASERTYLNYETSRALGALLPERTLVHGKLANGLALENRMAPLFVGRGFGNYADRLERDDARYILTYTLPKPGHEGPIILDVLEHYPQRRIVAEFDVAAFEIDTTPGTDRAALIDKFPDRPESRARHQ